MKATIAGLIFALFVLFGIPALAADTLTLYDNFNGSTLINPTKWMGSADDALDLYRNIVFPTAGDGELLLAARGYGFRTRNAASTEGEGRSVTNRLEFRRSDSTAIHAIKATVRVTSAVAVGCPAGADPVTQARFRLGGHFFNGGTGEQGHSVDDVYARIEVRRLSNNPTAGQLDIRAKVARSTEPAGVLEQVLFNQVLGTMTVGQTVTLLLEWDPVSNIFIFQVNSSPQVIFHYTLPDTAPPKASFKKTIGLTHYLPNCAAAQTQAYMAAYVDDVYINTTGALAAPSAGMQVESAPDAEPDN
jgi:hypothetical protein